jgi:hypothetical protein
MRDAESRTAVAASAEPEIDLGGVAVRIRTADAKTREILAGLRPWRGASRDASGPALDLDLVRIARPAAVGPPSRGATWTVRGRRHAIDSRWFRLAFDTGTRRGRASVGARFGLADFCRPLAGALLAAGDGFLLHAAALEAPGGGALLFTGPSGFGKTTLAKSVPRGVVLADDAVGMRIGPGTRHPVPGPTVGRGATSRRGMRPPESGATVTAHPTPFFGDYGRPPAGLKPGGRPVRALFLLEAPSPRTAAHAVRPATRAEAAARVITQILMANEAPPAMRAQLLDRAVAFVSAVPVFWFRYVPGPTVWAYVRDLQWMTTSGRGQAPPLPGRVEA